MENKSSTCHMTSEQRDLIDRKALLEKQYNSSPLKALQFVEMVVDVRDIEDAPTVYAVEVVHGKWVKQVEDDCYWYECSECAGVVPRTRHGHDWYSDYCPNCGAKMDGGNEDG